MGIQLIRLSQIKANLSNFVDFEQQLIGIFGDENTYRFVAYDGQETFILGKEYPVGKNAIKVFVNGILQVCDPTMGYVEINSMMISFPGGLQNGDILVVVYNNFNRYSTLMGQNRVKAFNIYRKTTFITTSNQNQTIFEAPFNYQTGLNQLYVYQNGLLLTRGSEYDYVEISPNQFQLNKPLPIGTTLTAEVISGGLMVYNCNRYPFFIDADRSTQADFTLPTAYKPGSNNLKVYLNGALLRCGENDDYIEIDPNTFHMNYDLPIGQTLEAVITTFSVDVFTITRVTEIIDSTTSSNLDIYTTVPYNMGESNLRVYLNGVLQRQGDTEDYTEIDGSTFHMNYTTLPIDSVLEYEIISW